MPLGRAEGMLRRVAAGRAGSSEVGREKEGSAALPKALWNSPAMGFLPRFTWLHASSTTLTEALTHTSPFQCRYSQHSQIEQCSTSSLLLGFYFQILILTQNTITLLRKNTGLPCFHHKILSQLLGMMGNQNCKKIHILQNKIGRQLNERNKKSF